MCSYTRQVNAFGTRMTVDQVVGFIQKNHVELLKDKKVEPHEHLTVTEIAKLLDIPQVQLREYAFAGVEMESQFASRLGNKLRQMFGDLKLAKTCRI